MSLLEDVFLQDETEEASALERVIEGEEFEHVPRSDDDEDNDSIKGDEAEEDKRRVDPKEGKQPRVIKNPRFVLNPARLTGPRGIQVIPEHFKDFKFKGKGHEKADLDMVLKKLEHWAYRLYPKFKFEDCLKKIETLGKKRPVLVHLHKIRSDQILSDEPIVQKDSSDDEAVDQPEDEFDKLLQQQIEIARHTPAPNSAKKAGFQTPRSDISTPFAMPKATSSPSISEEQRDRMLRNRKLAEERRLAKLKQDTQLNQSEPIEINTNNEPTKDKKKNRSNVISSDEEMENDNPIETSRNDMFDLLISDKNENKGVDLINNDPEHVIDLVSSENVDSIGQEIFNSNKLYEDERNKSNISDSSDEDCDMVAVNHSIVADVHTSINNDKNIEVSENLENSKTQFIETHKDVVEIIEDISEISYPIKENKDTNKDDNEKIEIIEVISENQPINENKDTNKDIIEDINKNKNTENNDSVEINEDIFETNNQPNIENKDTNKDMNEDINKNENIANIDTVEINKDIFETNNQPNNENKDTNKNINEGINKNVNAENIDTVEINEDIFEINCQPVKQNKDTKKDKNEDINKNENTGNEDMMIVVNDNSNTKNKPEIGLTNTNKVENKNMGLFLENKENVSSNLGIQVEEELMDVDFDNDF